MEQEVQKLIERFYKVQNAELNCMGGGFYGRVYQATFLQNDRWFDLIIKIYIQPEIARKEKLQLEVLRLSSPVKVPQVYHIHKADIDIPHDALLMEYIKGINGGSILPETNELREQIANEVTDVLSVLHKTYHMEGFGELDADSYVSDWRILYKRKAESIVSKATKLFSRQRISETVMSVVQEAYDQFDEIFYLPILKASLVHGDFNMWNVLLDESTYHVAAIIDPYGCCYGDLEFDLYQLNNANGREYGLLECYKRKNTLSENYEIKIAFYELFTEIMHYYDSDVKPNSKALEEKALCLNNCIAKLHERK